MITQDQNEKLYGISWWKEFVEEDKLKTVAEWVVIAEGLAKAHKGVLPNTGWLQRNGF